MNQLSQVLLVDDHPANARITWAALAGGMLFSCGEPFLGVLNLLSNLAGQ